MRFAWRHLYQGRILGLTVLLAVFFGGVLFLYPSQGQYLSPDETANAYFAEHFAATGSLAVADARLAGLGDAVFPRSLIAYHDQWLPGSFIGLPVIFGALSRLIGHWSIPLWTPLLAILAMLTYRALLSRIFSPALGRVSFYLLLFLPAWWYYAARPLMHNVAFVSFLVLAAYFFVCRPGEKHWPLWRSWPLNYFLSGSALGLALFFRLAEAPWIALALFGLLLYFRHALSWRALSAAVLGFVWPLALLLYFNAQTYGSPWLTGYTLPLNLHSAATAVSTPESLGLWNRVQDLAAPLFPFGLHPRNILRHLTNYGLFLMWWLSLPAVFGFLYFHPFRSGVKKPERAYWWLSFGVSVWLIVLYGSWAFHDNPDPLAVSLANSYARYWLPVYLLLLPYAGRLWLALRARFHPFSQWPAGIFASLLLCALSFWQTVFFPGDGLLPARENLLAAAALRTDLLAATPEDAVIVVDRADKILFPARLVRQPLRSDATYALLPTLAAARPLYYFGITLPPTDLDYLNQVRLPPLGLRLEPVSEHGIESLYQFQKIAP